MNRDQKDDKAELALLATLNDLPSAGAKRNLCQKIEIPWEEYLRLKRKWSRVLARWKKEKEVK